MDGIVFNIQRFSIHDGPGIRTTVFLKGCSLRCFWCHNPEGIRLQPDIQFYPDRCIGDAECARVCPEGSHDFSSGPHRFDREKCQACGECVEVCYTGALELAGREMTLEQVMAEILQDQPFYDQSGGGVTLSGGDPLIQRSFSLALLQECKARGIHTAIETAANIRWEQLSPLLAAIDLVMMDIKCIDDARHRQATGVSNRRILDNARQLAAQGVTLIFRTPVVPGVNDTPEEISAIAAFLREIIDQGKQAGAYSQDEPLLELLPFHRFAEEKYRSLDLPYRAVGLTTPGHQTMQDLIAAASAYGIQVRCQS